MTDKEVDFSESSSGLQGMDATMILLLVLLQTVDDDGQDDNQYEEQDYDEDDPPQAADGRSVDAEGGEQGSVNVFDLDDLHGLARALHFGNDVDAEQSRASRVIAVIGDESSRELSAEAFQLGRAHLDCNVSEHIGASSNDERGREVSKDDRGAVEVAVDGLSDAFWDGKDATGGDGRRGRSRRDGRQGSVASLKLGLPTTSLKDCSIGLGAQSGTSSSSLPSARPVGLPFLALSRRLFAW